MVFSSVGSSAFDRRLVSNSGSRSVSQSSGSNSVQTQLSSIQNLIDSTRTLVSSDSGSSRINRNANVNQTVLPILTTLANLVTQLISQLGNGSGSGVTEQSPEFVDGTSGPFDPDSVGGYGRNAFANRQELVDNGEFDPETTVVRYTRAEKPQFNDLFAYSQEAIAIRDSNGDGKLSFTEYSQTFDNRSNARKSFRVLDRNGDNKIDAVEISALGLLTDSNGDGEITPEERAAADDLINRNPSQAADELDSIIGELDLKRRFRRFERKIGEFFFDTEREF